MVTNLPRRLTDEQIHEFQAKIIRDVIPWVARSTVSFFHLRKDYSINEYTILDKDRSGVFIKIGSTHFILTAAHGLREYVENNIFLSMSWDDEINCPIPITHDKIAYTDEDSLDVAAIKLLDETAESLLRRHTPITQYDLASNCRTRDGIFLICGYARAGTIFTPQKYDQPDPPEITTHPFSYLSSRRYAEWNHHGLKFDPQCHIVLLMSKDAIVGESWEATQLPRFEDIQGISGCGVWLIADAAVRKPLNSITTDDCKLIAIEHRYDENGKRVAGTWIDIAMENIKKAFPETKAALALSVVPEPIIWTP
jgi:hypothetical protein